MAVVIFTVSCSGTVEGAVEDPLVDSAIDSASADDVAVDTFAPSESDSGSGSDSDSDSGVTVDTAFPDTALADSAPACPATLKVGGEYKIGIDAFTGNEATTQPKTDANDGKSGDNANFRRNNVARAHFFVEGYWYTSKHREAGEPNPTGPQWVDYTPPFAKIGGGKYKVFIKYRAGENRATYPAKYTITHAAGSSVVTRDQRLGVDIVELELGTYDFGCSGAVRAEDTGNDSISFGAARFVYVGP